MYLELPDEGKLQQAWEAIKVARKYRRQWESLIRVFARNPKLKLHFGPVSATDGQGNVYLRVPIELGLPMKHERHLCGMRGEGSVQLCTACAIREEILIIMLHECGHQLFETFEQLTPDEQERFLREAILMEAKGNPEVAARIEARWKEVGKVTDQLYNLQQAVSPFLPILTNVVEDVRVNTNMKRARPGTATMFDALHYHTFKDGIEGYDGSINKMNDAPPNFQAAISIYCEGSGLTWEPYIDPDIYKTLTGDAEFMKLCGQIDLVRSVRQSYALAYRFLVCLRRLGFFQSEEEVDLNPPPPEKGEGESSDDGESDQADEPTEDSESSDGDGDEGDKSESSEADDGEGSDDGESDDGDEEGDGSGDGDEADSEGSGDGDDADSGGDSGKGSNEDSGSGQGDGDGTGESGSSDGEGGGSGPASDGAADGADTDGNGGTDGASAPSSGPETGDKGNGNPAGGQGLPQGEGAGGGWTSKWTDMGSPQEVDDRLKKFTGHDADGNVDTQTSAVAEVQGHQSEKAAEENKKAVEVAIAQSQHFDKPSSTVPDLTVIHWGEQIGGWAKRNREIGMPEPAPALLAKTLNHLRLVFTENKRANKTRDLKKGRIDPRVLGKRIPIEDDRLFQRRTMPGRRDYHVVLGMDLSGSTSGGFYGVHGNNYDPSVSKLFVMKGAVAAQAEMLNRIGVSFSVWGHTGGGYTGVEIYEVKTAKERWGGPIRERLEAIQSSGGNLDGHSLEFYRKRAEESAATRRVVMYYTDGLINNIGEEWEVFTENVKLCQKAGIIVVGVEVGCDSGLTESLGLPCVPLNSMDDIDGPVKFLEQFMA